MQTSEGFCNYCYYFSGKLINVKKFHSLKITPVEHTEVRTITVKQHILLKYFAITFYSMSWRHRLLFQQPLKAIQLYIYNSIYQQTLCCSTELCFEAQLLPFKGQQRGAIWLLPARCHTDVKDVETVMQEWLNWQRPCILVLLIYSYSNFSVTPEAEYACSLAHKEGRKAF